MILDLPRGYAVVDTSVLSYFTSQSDLGVSYRELLAHRTIALSYFVKTELDGKDWGQQRRARLNSLYQECVRLEPSDATSTWYNKGHAKRRETRKWEVGDMDLWIIAHAAEYGVPYVSHDRSACEIARALGVEVLTALDQA